MRSGLEDIDRRRASPLATVRAGAALCALAALVAVAPASADAFPSAAALALSGGGPIPPAERVEAPDVTLSGSDGSERALDALDGEVVYVDFWASWCPPCLRSFPWMDALEARFARRGLRVVAINLDAERADATRFLETTPVRFDVAFDPAGTSAEAFGLLGMPSSYLIDREGRVALAHVGFRRRDAAALEAAIAAVLAEPSGETGGGAPLVAESEVE